MSEQWRPITGYEGLYEVSDHGRARSVARTVKDKNGQPMRWKSKILKPGRNRKGYLLVTLSREGKTKSFLLSRLVCAAFNGPPKDGQFCLHGDGDPENNRPSNLRWGDHTENMEDMIRHGNNGKKLAAEDIPKIVESYKTIGRNKTAVKFGIAKTTVHAICTGKIWRKETKGTLPEVRKYNTLDDSQVGRIDSMRERFSMQEIADKMNVSRATLYNCLKRRASALGGDVSAR